jgi:hypothetical protein
VPGAETLAALRSAAESEGPPWRSFEAAGLPADPADMDDGFVSLSEYPAAEFVTRCRQLRFWDRQQIRVA